MAVVVLPTIHTRAQCEDEIVHVEHVLQVKTCAPLRPARVAPSRQRRWRRGTLGHDRAVDIQVLETIAVHATPIEPGAEEVVAADRSRPLNHRTNGVGRHRLVGREADDAAWRARIVRSRVHGEERAVEGVVVGEKRRLQIALVWHAHADTTAGRGPLRVIDFANLAVDAVLLEVATAEEDAHPIVGAIVGLDVEVLEVDLRVVVDGPALVGDDYREPVSVERTALDRDAELAPHIAREEVGFGTVVVAVLRFELHRPARRAG